MPAACQNCGFQNPPGMRFCGNCGARLSSPTQAVTPPVYPEAQFAAAAPAVLMGSDLMERFRQAGLEAAGQRRSVTVLFADLSDYTGLAEQVDGEFLYETIQQVMRLLVEAVYRYEGMVDKIIGDGLMALFGAPIASENNAERAVRAALEMQASLETLNQSVRSRLGRELRLHIGLHSGTVIVGGVGSDLLMDYTAIGDTVNLAHRLEEVAPPGTILSSESVQRATRVLFDFEPKPALSLKGVSQPVNGYRVIGHKARPGSLRGLEGLRAPLVGRQEELLRLVQAAESLAQRKRGQFALVTGEAGIGKSRLTGELKSRLARARLRLLEGQSLTYRRSVSYWIFLELLRDYLGVTAETPKPQVRTRLVSQAFDSLGAQAGEALPYLEHLLGLEHADAFAAERLAYLDPGQLRQQIFLAVRDLLVAEAQRLPLLLILEDLHWADEASLELLAFLVESIPQAPLMIYAISRPIEGGRLKEIAERASQLLGERFHAIQLRNLSRAESERLISELLAIPELPLEMRQQVLQRAAGVPFYLEEILRMLIENRVIHQEDGHWRLVPGAEASALGVPTTLQDLILARFDRLDPFPRQVLQTASVIGREFTPPLLAQVLQSNAMDDIQSALHTLVEKAFLVPQAGQDSGYAFRHVLTTDAVYSTLLRRDRDDLHGRVGEAIEIFYAGRLESQIELLASHFLRSPRLDRALHYLILAGQKSARDYANRQARQHYEDALALLPRLAPTPDQFIQVRAGLGDVLTFTGEYAPAREHYLAALQYSASSLTRDYSGLQRKIAATFERQGDFDQASLHLAEAARALEGAFPALPVETAKVFNDQGWIHFLRGDFDEAGRYLSQALNLVGASRQYDVVASIHNRLGALAYQQRAYDQASAQVRKSLELRETIGDLAGVARLHNNLGLLGLVRGDLRGAEASFVQSLELLERLGEAEGICLATVNLGLVQLERGDFPAAEASLEKGQAFAEQNGQRFYLALACLYLGRLHSEQGRAALAGELLQRSLRIFTELGAQDNLVDAACYLGENFLAHGDLAGARQWLERSYQAMSSPEKDGKNGTDGAQTVQRGRVLRLHAAVARLSGEAELAQGLLKESSAIFTASAERLEAARTAYEAGQLALSLQDRSSARKRFEEARAVFQQLGAEYDAKRARQALAELARLPSQAARSDEVRIP